MLDYPPASVEQDPWAAARLWPYHAARLVKGGHRIGCLFRLEGERDEDGELIEDERLVAVVNGIAQEITTEEPPYWPWKAVDRQDCDYLLQLASWARAHDGNHPILTPRTAIPKEGVEIF